MKHEYGASMIEIIGVLAIAGLMSGAAIAMYNVIRGNQVRKIAAVEMEEIVRDTKMLMGMRGDYTGISVEYLISAGALDNAKAPIGGDGWSVTSIDNGAGFAINLTQLTQGECQYFATSRPKWATEIQINNVKLDGADTENCFSTDTNQMSFIVK